MEMKILGCVLYCMYVKHDTMYAKVFECALRNKYMKDIYMERRGYMLKRKHIFLSVVIEAYIIFLTGCGSSSISDPMETANISDTGSEESGMTETETDTAVLSEKSQSETEEKPDDTPIEVPQLPRTGEKLEDFVPKGWELLDSVELDFNEDGIFDYVGVLQDASMENIIDFMQQEDYQWILFAIAGDGTKGYCLDFQDSKLINDYGVTLTAEKTAFTVHGTYGTMLGWSLDHPNDSRGTDDDTYTYRDGDWWHTLSERTYGFGDYITDYSRDDWESGVGIRKSRSSAFEDIEKNYKFGEYENRESIEYDVVYEVALDEPLTLEQISKQRELSPYGVRDWEVDEIAFAADVALSEDMVKSPDESLSSCLLYWDENCVLYVFHTDPDTDEGFYCLAMYDRQDRKVTVLAKEESEIDYQKLYKGKIYYSTEIVENVTYKMTESGKGQLTEEEAVVGIRLGRMNPDGTEKEAIFEYRYPKTEQDVLEDRVPYLGLIYEISGDEIVAEVYIGDEQHPFYRMHTDGSKCKKIGQMPKE